MRTADELSKWQKYMTLDEIKEMKRIAKLSVQNGVAPVFINIGAGAGTSTFAMLEAVPNCVVFSIDLRTNDGEEYTNEHLRLKGSHIDYQMRVKRIWGDSKLVGKNWPFKVDMVFVDGDHTREGCEGDILSWIRNIEPTGYILFHDYGSFFWGTVKEVVDEFMDGYEKIGLVDTLMVYKCQLKNT